ncbi:STAS domain-containing protein [Microbispora hainanensis]|jgi:anti-sigma B factor antagonist|uniref:Anti-sigma factor antagonist n=1 Tax=Microbispora hainanensis TaxID=568844 RepID=A0ABZ1SNM1_9ACTN|nr:STAS domain-containing protein [Microbispora hainanensis]HEU4567977.1 STAS domain-containing protein [Marmoricola sp.]
MTTRLGVTVSHEATHTLVTLTGELDVISCERLRTVFGKVFGELPGALPDEGAARLVVDASGLTFCDSMGLRLLLETHDHAVEAGGFLKLAGVRGVLLRILTVTGLHAAFPVHETVEDALASLDD